MEFVCFNGEFLPANEPLFTAQNRSFRYGDGIFETIKVDQGNIVLEQFHYDRLLLGLKMLQIENPPEVSQLSHLIGHLCGKNNCNDLARIRLVIYRNSDNKAGFVIEAVPLAKEMIEWNENGLTIDLYPYARKNADAFSNFKTANFLAYVLAELFAKERGLDDAIVLNSFNLICDSSKANIFLVKDNLVSTPALHQGCIGGVMRRFVIDQLKVEGISVKQTEISEKDLHGADEVFLTNSIQGIKWVQYFRDCVYGNEFTLRIHQIISSKLYS